jgi:hypothetical protein
MHSSDAVSDLILNLLVNYKVNLVFISTDHESGKWTSEGVTKDERTNSQRNEAL